MSVRPQKLGSPRGRAAPATRFCRRGPTGQWPSRCPAWTPLGSGLHVAADHVADAIAVEVAGGLKTTECAPRLRRERAKCAELAVNRTPEIGKAVAVEVSRPGPQKALDDVCLAACRRGEHVNDRWIGRKVRIIGEHPGPVAADW